MKSIKRAFVALAGIPKRDQFERRWANLSADQRLCVASPGSTKGFANPLAA